MVEFPISGVETYVWLPPLVAFLVAALTSLGGLSGAFLILPFQVSILGYTGPGVSATNLIYNVVGTPGGIIRYWREDRLIWPLAWAIVVGSLPGVLAGAYIRIEYLPDPLAFKLFVGCVLLFLAIKMLVSVARGKRKRPMTGEFDVVVESRAPARLTYTFQGHRYDVAPWQISATALLIGVVAGTYGIGGGALMVPLLVSVFGLPIHTVAGAALFGNFVTSAVGVGSYLLLVGIGVADRSALPDWWLGLSFGVGGLLGTYVGAWMQRWIPARIIAMIIIAALLFIATRYILDFFGA